jgi:hypothetical protein
MRLLLWVAGISETEYERTETISNGMKRTEMDDIEMEAMSKKIAIARENTN